MILDANKQNKKQYVNYKGGKNSNKIAIVLFYSKLEVFVHNFISKVVMFFFFVGILFVGGAFGEVCVF